MNDTINNPANDNAGLAITLPPGTPTLVCREHGIDPNCECIVCCLLWPKEKLHG